jgi:hypothetical protein
MPEFVRQPADAGRSPATRKDPPILGSPGSLGSANEHTPVVVLRRMQRTHGNQAVQRLVRRLTSSLAVQRNSPAATVTPPTTTTAEPAQQSAAKDPSTDAPAAWALMRAFTDSELKSQISSMYTAATANLFFRDWVPYFGTPERAAYFGAIRLGQVEGPVHLHEVAASRLEMVMARVGKPNMPYSDVALGLVRGRPSGVKNLLQPHLGLAIDFRANASPKIGDRRLKTLIKLQTGEAKAHYMELGDYGKRRALIKSLGQATMAARARSQQEEMANAKVTNPGDVSDEAKARIAAAAADPDSKLGKQGAEFYQNIESEYARVAAASKRMMTGLPPAVQAYLTSRQQERDLTAQIKDIDAKLADVARKKEEAEERGFV